MVLLECYMIFCPKIAIWKILGGGGGDAAPSPPPPPPRLVRLCKGQKIAMMPNDDIIEFVWLVITPRRSKGGRWLSAGIETEHRMSRLNCLNSSILSKISWNWPCHFGHVRNHENVPLKRSPNRRVGRIWNNKQCPPKPRRFQNEGDYS